MLSGVFGDVSDNFERYFEPLDKFFEHMSDHNKIVIPVPDNVLYQILGSVNGRGHEFHF